MAYKVNQGEQLDTALAAETPAPAPADELEKPLAEFDAAQPSPAEPAPGYRSGERCATTRAAHQQYTNKNQDLAARVDQIAGERAYEEAEKEMDAIVSEVQQNWCYMRRGG